MGRERKHQGVYEKNPGSGVWYVEWYEGKRRRKKKIGPKHLAIQFAEQMRARVRVKRHAPELVLERQPKTLAEAIEHHLAVSSNVSRADDERNGKRFKAAFPGALLSEITPERVDRWAAERAKSTTARGGPPSPAYINRELSFLRRVFTRAVKAGWCLRNPVSDSEAFYRKLNNGRLRFLNEEEEQALRPHFHPDAWLCVELAIQTGMRRREQFRLRREDVDLDNRVIWVRQAKDPRARQGVSTGRHVWLNTRAVEILREILARHASQWVFPSKTGVTPIGADNFYKRVFLPAVQRAGLEGVTWHTLRHTFGSRLAQRGIPLYTIGKLMGQKRPETTQRYAHLTDRQVMEAVEVLVPTAPTTAPAGSKRGRKAG